MNEKYYWVYILHCDNDTYYTGYTVDLEKRYQAHCKGKASKYTRSFKPLSIARAWKIKNNKSLAMKLERHIKQLARAEKLKIIMFPELLEDFLISAVQ